MSKGEIVGRPVQRTVVGQPAAVEHALLALKQRGDLVIGQPIPQVRHLSDGRVAVAVRVIDRTPAPTPVRRRVRTRWVVTGAVGGTAAVGGFGYLVYLALPALEVMAAVAVLLALAWFLAGQKAACPGLHCPGCRCHR